MTVSAESSHEPLILAFSRGVSPEKWAARWRSNFPHRPLTLQPLTGSESGDSERFAADVSLLRFAPNERPDPHLFHGVQLYEESVALVVPRDHELADVALLEAETLSLIDIFEHPEHHAAWPAARAWGEGAQAPETLKDAIEVVAAGVGALLAPLPLARHFARKDVSIVPVAHLPATSVWAVWRLERDDAVIQNLIGVLRGRTKASSRNDPDAFLPRQGQAASATNKRPGRNRSHPSTRRRRR